MGAHRGLPLPTIRTARAFAIWLGLCVLWAIALITCVVLGVLPWWIALGPLVIAIWAVTARLRFVRRQVDGRDRGWL